MFGIDHLLPQAHGRPEYRNRSSVCHQGCSESIDVSSLDELKNAVFSIDCHLKKTARSTVFSDGNPNSEIMMIGEAPGQEEDEQGKPFVGQSGRLLDSMLKAVGIARDEVYITNVVFWRPPGNRTPAGDEINLCMPYVLKHISLIHPKLIVLLGGVAVKAILETNSPISHLRGSKSKVMGIDAIATFHPAYLLRSPGQKAAVFRDFIAIKKIMRI
jgi:DNA polymerase